MNEFKKRVDAIYPSNLIAFILITLLSVIAILVVGEPGYYLNVLSVVIFFVWLYVAIVTLDKVIIRHRIFKAVKTSKQCTYDYFARRARKEHYKINLFKGRLGKTKEELIEELVLDLKKGKIV